jgi:hypothetical protein
MAGWSGWLGADPARPAPGWVLLNGPSVLVESRTPLTSAILIPNLLVVDPECAMSGLQKIINTVRQMIRLNYAKGGSCRLTHLDLTIIFE